RNGGASADDVTISDHTNLSVTGRGEGEARDRTSSNNRIHGGALGGAGRTSANSLASGHTGHGEKGIVTLNPNNSRTGRVTNTARSTSRGDRGATEGLHRVRASDARQ